MENPKKITVLGGGHGAHAMAADLTLRGYEVTMFEMPEYTGNLEQLFETREIKITGVINGVAKIANVTSNISEAVKDANMIALVVPAFAHPAYAELLKGQLTEDQTLILYPGTFGSLQIREALGDENCPIIAETDTLPYDARLEGPCHINVFGTNVLNIAFLPSSRGDEVIDELSQMYEFTKIYEDVMECGLSSINPALHSGPCLLNLGPIEYWAKGDFYLYEHGFTPSAARVNKELDNERKSVGEVFGYTIDAMENFAGMKEGWGWKDMYRAIHGEIALTPIVGPNDIFNRYLTEDAPFGLVTWSSIARLADVTTPTIDAIVNIYSVAHEVNWWEKGRTTVDLGISNMSIEDVKQYLKTGVKEERKALSV